MNNDINILKNVCYISNNDKKILNNDIKRLIYLCNIKNKTNNQNFKNYSYESKLQSFKFERLYIIRWMFRRLSQFFKQKLQRYSKFNSRKQLKITVMNSNFSLIDICKKADLYLSDANISNEDAENCINRINYIVKCNSINSLMLHCTDDIDLLHRCFGMKYSFMPDYFWHVMKYDIDCIFNQFDIPKLTKLRSEM